MTKEHFKGAVSEYLAASWYLAKNCQVYWPAVQQGSVDFVVEVDGVFKRVQVRTATWNKSGNNHYLQCRVPATNKGVSKKAPCELYDVLFVVADEYSWVIPASEIDSKNLSLEGQKRETRWERYRINN